MLILLFIVILSLYNLSTWLSKTRNYPCQH